MELLFTLAGVLCVVSVCVIAACVAMCRWRDANKRSVVDTMLLSTRDPVRTRRALAEERVLEWGWNDGDGEDAAEHTDPLGAAKGHATGGIVAIGN